jgi:hypothetical protein
MEENDHTIESDEETSGVDAPSEATQWAEEAEQEGDDSGYDPDEDLGALDDEEPGDLDEEPNEI